MKLKELTQKLAMLDHFHHPIVFLDHDHPTFGLKYRRSNDLPLSFHDKFNFELAPYMDNILDLEITFVSDDNQVMKIYLKGIMELMKKIEGGKPV